MNEAWKLLLTCTDRGQHSTATLGSIRRLANGITLYVDDENARQTVKTRGQGETGSRADGGITYRVRCKRCGRDKPIRMENVFKIVAEGFGQVDISILP